MASGGGGAGGRAGTQAASPQPCPQQPLDEESPVPPHTCQPSSQLPGPGPTMPVLTSRENSSQYSISCLFITCCLPTPSTLLLEAEDKMSQGSMSKGPFSCHGKMRGLWESYLGLGAAAWLITCSSLTNASRLKGTISIFFFFFNIRPLSSGKIFL